MIRPGEVYMADFAEAGPHPVIVLSREELNRGRYALVVVCTSARFAVRSQLREEYDFSQGVRGKHYEAYRAGHVVRVLKSDGSIEERHFTLGDGAVMLDPDLKLQFPDSESVNRALRLLVAQG